MPEYYLIDKIYNLLIFRKLYDYLFMIILVNIVDFIGISHDLKQILCQGQKQNTNFSQGNSNLDLQFIKS